MSKSEGGWTSTKPKRRGGRKDRPFMQGYGSRLSGIDERGRNLAAVTESARRKERRTAEEARSAANEPDTSERDTWQSGWEGWSTGWSWNWEEGADRTQWARPHAEATEEEATSSWEAARARERSRSKKRASPKRGSSSAEAQSGQPSVDQAVHAMAQTTQHTDSTLPEGVRTTQPPAPDQCVEDPAANFDFYWNPLQANIQSAKLSRSRVRCKISMLSCTLRGWRTLMPSLPNIKATR
eukprot:3270801-Amphidinium_carterae.1